MVDENETVPDEIKDSPHFANLRRRAENAEAGLATAKEVIGGLRDVVARNAIELAGFTPNPETGEFDGVTGLLVKEFKSSLTDDTLPTKDDFLALAGQYQVTPPTAAAPTEQPTIADQIASMQQGATQLQQLGTVPSGEPGDIDSQMQAALDRGDTGTVLALQMKKLSGAPGAPNAA